MGPTGTSELALDDVGVHRRAVARTAGVLEGLCATTHWLFFEQLRAFAAEPTLERVLEQGKVITAAGVGSGIDMALRLAQLIAGDAVAQAVQRRPPNRSSSSCGSMAPERET